MMAEVGLSSSLHQASTPNLQTQSTPMTLLSAHQQILQTESSNFPPNDFPFNSSQNTGIQGFTNIKKQKEANNAHINQNNQQLNIPPNRKRNKPFDNSGCQTSSNRIEDEEEEEDEEDEDITTDDEEINSDEELDEDDSQFPDEDEMIDQMMMEDEEDDDDDDDDEDEDRQQRKQSSKKKIQQDQAIETTLDRCTNHQAADMGGINYLSQNQSAVNYSQKYGQGAQNSQTITVPRPNRQIGSVNHVNQQMQNSQKQQYGTGSSGTSGSMFRTGQLQTNSVHGLQSIGLGARTMTGQSNNQYPAILSVFQYGQNQFEELKQNSANPLGDYYMQQTNQQSLNQSNNAGDQTHQQFEINRSLANVGTTGSGGGATQRRNRRGNRQQNQQPSSGINGGELRQTNNNTGGTPQQRRQNRQSKNRQGRQGTGSKQSLMTQSVQLPENQLQTIIDEFERAGGQDTNEQFGFERPNSEAEAIMPSGSTLINHQPSGENGMNSAATPPQINNEQRGRHLRPYNRGRKQKNNQQPLGFSQGQQVPFQSSGSQQAQSSQPNLGSSCQNSQMEPVSLSQERQEREQQLQQQSRTQVRNPQGTAGQGGLIHRSLDSDHAVQQVIQMGAPASTNQHQEFSRYTNNPQIQSSAIQGAQALIYGSRPVSATQSIPASSASRTNRVGASAPSAQNLSIDSFSNQFNQQVIRGPVANQIQGRNISANIASSGSLEGINNPGQGGSVISNGAAVHTIPFESGSTSFMGIGNLPGSNIDEQSSSGLPNTFMRSQGQPQNNQQKTRAGTGTFDNNLQRRGVINHSISQVSQGSSPPSNNLNQIQVNLGQDNIYHNPHTGSSNQGGNRMQQSSYGFQGINASQASVSQQQLRGLNIPNSSDTNGPGAVGAPPSNNLHVIRQTAQNNPAAINPSYSQYSNSQQRQRNPQFLPASRQNFFNNIPSSSGHNESSGNQAQQSVGVHNSYLVSVPEYVHDIFREQEGELVTNNIEIAQASGAQHPFIGIDSDQSNQQAIGIFPNSLFGTQNEENTATNQGSGGSTIINNQSNNQNRLSVSPQLPAAFRANQQYNSGVNQSYQTFEEQSYQNMRRTPPRRNNDSKKTSGANTPREDGANTPTTHQTYQSMRVSGNGFGSAVAAGLNNHLQRYSYQEQSIRQTQPSLQGGGRAPDTSMSITDQNFGGEGQSQNFQMNTASLFDDFSPSGGGPNQMDRGAQANER